MPGRARASVFLKQRLGGDTVQPALASEQVLTSGDKRLRCNQWRLNSFNRPEVTSSQFSDAMVPSAAIP